MKKEKEIVGKIMSVGLIPKPPSFEIDILTDKQKLYKAKFLGQEDIKGIYPSNNIKFIGTPSKDGVFTNPEYQLL
jgi:hypothetical protein